MTKKNGLPIHADDLRAMGEDVVSLLAQLPPEKAEELIYTWAFWARPQQIAPEGNWNVWYVNAGRGFGKTRAGVEWVRAKVKNGTKRIAAIAATNSDIERVMVNGESGFLARCWRGDKDHKGKPLGNPLWAPTKRLLTWENGAYVQFFSAEEPERLRGPQFEAAWCDELAAWNKDRDTWDMLQFTLRLGKHPQVCVTTTPRPTKLVRDILKNPKSVVTYGSTFDNSVNLAPTFIQAVKDQYEGTRLGRQELYAEIMDEASGALWTRELLSRCEVEGADDPVAFAKTLARVVISVDPAVTSNAESDMTGIIVAGIDLNGCSYILEDATDRYTPEGWATKAIALYNLYEADKIVAERNQGGDMVRSTLHTVDETVPVKLVHASRGKFARAEPVSSLYERGKVKHLRGLDALEDQLVQWEPLGSIGSPDRLDACLEGNTPVLTASGYKPISSVIVGEQVLTREGFKSVSWSGLTKSSAKTLDIQLSNGHMIKATPEHPFYVQGKGWTPAGELTCGDSLITEQEVWNCKNTLSKLSSTTKHTDVTQTAQTRVNNATTSALVALASEPCIEMSGNTTTAQSLKDTTSTTRMETSSTTTFQTLIACLQKNMLKNTLRISTKSVSNRWLMLVSLLTSGMGHLKVWSSTSGWVRSLGKTENLSTTNAVVLVDNPSRLTNQTQTSVAKSASSGMSESQRSILKMSVAQSVEQLSPQGSMGLVQKPVPVSVVQVCESKSEIDVYNLHVKDCHEFVACGVLVHNCVWAITELALKGIAKPELNLAYSDAKGLSSRN
jgi:phage terminase large subunit-like protein